MTKRKYGKYKLMVEGTDSTELILVEDAPVSTQRSDIEAWLKDDKNAALILNGMELSNRRVHIIRDDVTMELGRKQTVTREVVEDEG